MRLTYPLFAACVRTINFSDALVHACLFVIECVCLGAYATPEGGRETMRGGVCVGGWVGGVQCSAGTGRAVGWQMPEGFIRRRRRRKSGSPGSLSDLNTHASDSSPLLATHISVFYSLGFVLKYSH